MTTENSCTGCARGLPLVGFMHRGARGPWDRSPCTRRRVLAGYPSRAALLRAFRAATRTPGYHHPDGPVWNMIAASHPDWPAIVKRDLRRIDVRDGGVVVLRFLDGEVMLNPRRMASTETPEARLAAALWRVVEDHVAAVRKREARRLRGPVRIESAPPFMTIVRAFLRAEESTPRTRWSRTVDAPELADLVVAARFSALYRRTAVLCAVRSPAR